MRSFVKSLAVFAVAGLSAVAGNSVAKADGLQLDSANSKIEFVGTKPGGSHDGGFKDFTASATIDPANPLSGTLSIEIDSTSLWSDHPKLTNHLKNPDFFDVRKFPKISFKSTEMMPGESAGAGMVKGEMTMLGKTNEVEFPVTCAVDGTTCTLTGEFKIDRT
ncbi:MAG: YceI family protein [Planctomycetota bacterium]